MKITFPHMGSIYIPGEAFSARTGSRSRCAPVGHAAHPRVDVNTPIGSASTPAASIGGFGSLGPRCRYSSHDWWFGLTPGYYAEVQRQILEELGTGLDILVLEQPFENPRRIPQTRRLLNEGIVKPASFRAQCGKTQGPRSLATVLAVHSREHAPWHGWLWRGAG